MSLPMDVARVHAPDFSESDTLKDGTRVTIRALHPDDRQRLVEAFRLLDRDSIDTRFFTHRSGFSQAEIDRAINGDFVNEVALVVTIQGARAETDILERNRSMLAVFTKCGFPMRQRQEGDVIHLTLALDTPLPQATQPNPRR